MDPRPAAQLRLARRRAAAALRAVSLAGLLLHRRLLDVLALGDEEAATLGVNVGRVRLAARRLRDDRHGGGGRGQRADRLRRDHRPARHPARRRAAATGCCCRSRCWSAAGFLVLADVSPAPSLSPAELPIGVVTAFFGAPFFAVVLRTSRGG